MSPSLIEQKGIRFLGCSSISIWNLYMFYTSYPRHLSHGRDRFATFFTFSCSHFLGFEDCGLKWLKPLVELCSVCATFTFLNERRVYSLSELSPISHPLLHYLCCDLKFVLVFFCIKDAFGSILKLSFLTPVHFFYLAFLCLSMPSTRSHWFCSNFWYFLYLHKIFHALHTM